MYTRSPGNLSPTNEYDSGPGDESIPDMFAICFREHPEELVPTEPPAESEDPCDSMGELKSVPDSEGGEDVVSSSVCSRSTGTPGANVGIEIFDLGDAAFM